MALITLPPKVHFETVSKLQLLRRSTSLRSRYTGKRQVVNFPFAMWVLEGKLIAKRGADAGRWRSFLTQMEGQVNTFRLPVPGTEEGPLSGYSGPMGTAGSAPARARSIQTSGWAPNSLVLLDGDWFTVNDELKVSTGDVFSDGSGSAAIVFEPFLRKPLTGSSYSIFCAAADTADEGAPYMLMHGASDDSASWGLEHPVDHNIGLSLVEAI